MYYNLEKYGEGNIQPHLLRCEFSILEALDYSFYKYAISACFYASLLVSLLSMTGSDEADDSDWEYSDSDLDSKLIVDWEVCILGALLSYLLVIICSSLYRAVVSFAFSLFLLLLVFASLTLLKFSVD